MTLSLSTTAPATTTADALIIAIMTNGKPTENGKPTQSGNRIEIAAHGLPAPVVDAIQSALATVGAKGKSGEVTRIPSVKGVKAPVIIAVGLGTQGLTEQPRRTEARGWQCRQVSRGHAQGCHRRPR